MISLRKCNSALAILNMLVALFILLTPFLPMLTFFVKQKTADPPVIVSQAEDTKAPFPTDNRLVVPTLLLDEPIHEGTAAVLNKGIWLRPSTATPNTGGNTVLAGHLFTYDDPEGVFYHLSKLKVGDVVASYWQGVEYLYEVSEIKEVPATAIEIEAPTTDNRLTIYTCTPLWNPENRLVVTAKLTEVNQQ